MKYMKRSYLIKICVKYMHCTLLIKNMHEVHEKYIFNQVVCKINAL